jgi:acetylornithine deacetylase/succinyl-diaminopimelate desuccinylase-like protein
MADRQKAVAYAQNNREQFLDELNSFLSIPSISTDSSHQGDIRRAAQWLSDRLESMGATQVELLPTEGKPIVTGLLQAARAEAPTVLVYGHYDVQPVDPLELWESDPFTPSERDGALYARGASDMKGQVMACFSALRAIQSTGELPLNVRFLLEGEEEIGSPSLKGSLEQYADRFRADLCLNPDTGMLGAESPTITYGLRGLAYYELHVDGPAQDLHSGKFGGAVHNPAQVLTDLISGMHDEQGRVTLPGFYDAVRELSPDERAELARLPNDERFFREQTGVPKLWGEEGYTAAERVGARPTLEVNGLYSGFTGEGAKTVLPATAMAKISMRLVPDQDPEKIRGQLEQYLDAHTPETVRYRLVQHAAGPPLLVPHDSAGNRALAEAMRSVWGVDPYFEREGGSVPVSSYLDQLLGVPSVLTGFGLPDDNIHAPNEKLDLQTWYRGTEALVHFFLNFAEQVNAGKAG